MVATETLVGLASVAIAGAVAYTVISRPEAAAAPLVPELKMPDIGITMPDIKFPEELKIAGLPEIPTADELKEIFAAPLAGITEKVPTLDELINKITETFPWFEDPLKYLKEETPEEMKKFLSDPWGYMKENAPDEFKKFMDNPGEYIKDTVVDPVVEGAKEIIPDYIEDPIKYVSEGIGGVLEPTAGIEFPIKAKVLDPIVAPLAGMEAAPSLFWGIAQGLRSGVEKVVEESWSYAVDTLRPYAATLEAMR